MVAETGSTSKLILGRLSGIIMMKPNFTKKALGRFPHPSWEWLLIFHSTIGRDIT